MENLGAVCALSVKIAAPLVGTVESTMRNYPWWTSRELRRTSGSHFPRVRILDPVFAIFGGPFWLILVDSGASRPRNRIPDDLTDLGTQNESSGACLRPDFDHFREKCERFFKKIQISKLRNLQFRVSIVYPEIS